LSREGRERHPVASAFVGAVTYGTGAADRFRQMDREDEQDEAYREERRAREEERRFRDEDRRERRNREAQTPSARRPTPVEIEEMRKYGRVWSDSEGKFISTEAGQTKETWSNQPPAGIKVPPGQRWVPDRLGGHFVDIPKEPGEGRGDKRSRQQIEQGIRMGRKDVAAYKASLTKMRDRLAALRQSMSLDPRSPDRHDQGSRVRDLEDSIVQTEAIVAQADADLRGDYGQLQEYLPEHPNITWEDYYEMPEKDQMLFRETFRMPPGPDPGPPQIPYRPSP